MKYKTKQNQPMLFKVKTGSPQGKNWLSGGMSQVSGGAARGLFLMAALATQVCSFMNVMQ